MGERSPIRVSRRQQLERLRGTPLNVAVWVIAFAVALWMLADRSAEIEFTGLARALEYEISPAAAGSVATLLVDLYEPVESGQPLVRLDDTAVVARLETARAALARSQAELAAQMAAAGFDDAGLAEDLRRFQVDEERLRLQVLELRVALEADRIEADRQAIQLKRTAALFADGILSESEYDDQRLLSERVERRIAEQEVLLAQTEEEQRIAAARVRSFEQRFSVTVAADSVIEPLRSALRIAELEVAEVEIERRGLTLRAPVNGRIGRVLARPGRSVTVGEPLLTVVEEIASEVVAYLPESHRDSIELGSTLVAWRRGAPTQTAESVVVRIGPAIEELPQRLWHDPNVPQYGRPFVVQGVAPLRPTPGEELGLRSL